MNSITGICLQHFRKWKNDYRIYLIAVILGILVYNFQSDLNDISAYLGIKSTQWSFPFLYAQFYMKLVFTIPLIFLFCDAPYKDSNYLFVVVRSGNMKWAIGEILYTIFASGIYYIYIFVLTLLFAIGNADFSMEWGKVFQTISNSEIAYQLEKYYVECSNIVTGCFTPLQAVWFTFFMSWLCGIFLGLTVFLCNNIFQNKITGISVASVFVIFSFLVANGDLSMLLKFSPISWNTLNLIDVGGYTNYPSFTYCVSVLLLLIVTLIAFILLTERRIHHVKNH